MFGVSGYKSGVDRRDWSWEANGSDSSRGDWHGINGLLVQFHFLDWFVLLAARRYNWRNKEEADENANDPAHT